MAGGVLSGQDTGSSRRTNGARISIRKGHTPIGKALDIWRLIKGSLAVQRRVCPTEIISQDKDNILRRITPGKN